MEAKESESERNDGMVISEDTTSATENASEHIATCLVTSPVVTLKKKRKCIRTYCNMLSNQPCSHIEKEKKMHQNILQHA